MKTARDERRVFIGEKFDCRVPTPQGGIRFPVQVQSVRGKVLLVRASKNLLSKLARGQEVNAVFVRPGKAFRFKPVIGDIHTDGDALILTFSGSFSVEQIERREHSRRSVKGTLEFRSPAGTKPITYRGKVANVSQGGMMFSTMFGGMFGPGSKPVGKKIHFDLKLLTDRFPNLVGTVKHAWPHPKLREIVLVNISFETVTPGMLSRIQRLIRR